VNTELQITATSLALCIALRYTMPGGLNKPDWVLTCRHFEKLDNCQVNAVSWAV